MDEATKLLRELCDAISSGHLYCANLRATRAIAAARAHLEALPAAAPPSATNWPQLPTMADYAAALPAPLPGPPREPTTEMMLAGMAFRDEVDDCDTGGIWRAMFDAAPKAQGEGDCVIAPNPTGVQGQNTMQAGGDSGDQTERLAGPAAKSLSHAGDDAADPGRTA